MPARTAFTRLLIGRTAELVAAAVGTPRSPYPLIGVCGYGNGRFQTAEDSRGSLVQLTFGSIEDQASGAERNLEEMQCRLYL